jgi:hypothetical protein
LTRSYRLIWTSAIWDRPGEPFETLFERGVESFARRCVEALTGVELDPDTHIECMRVIAVDDGGLDSVGDERLGRRRARVVAQPPGASCSESRSRQRAVHGHGTGRRGRGALTLVAGWRDIDKKLDASAALRSSETAVVVLEPRSSPVPMTAACFDAYVKP